jgi:hypothetical protein
MALMVKKASNLRDLGVTMGGAEQVTLFIKLLLDTFSEDFYDNLNDEKQRSGFGSLASITLRMGLEIGEISLPSQVRDVLENLFRPFIQVTGLERLTIIWHDGVEDTLLRGEGVAQGVDNPIVSRN